MSNIPPLQSPRKAHCVCMSGLTDAQLKLLNLHGALHVVEWLAVEAQQAVSGPAPMGEPTLHDHLKKLQNLLLRAQGLCLRHAFPGSAP